MRIGNSSAVYHQIGLVSWLAAASLAACAGGTTGRNDATFAAAQEPGAPVDAAQARQLFAQHCAACHGATGRGDGSAAYLLSPAPRDFGSTRFRIVSTKNGVPTEDDLVSVLQHGMPGSAMPAWEWLTPGEQRALAVVVRELAIAGRIADLVRNAEVEEEELSSDEALEIATRAMTPGETVTIPPETEVSAADLLEGRRLYMATCAACHADDGTGRGVDHLLNEDGTPATPRDFTAGLFKGGSTHADIVRRLTIGLPGSPMPATAFDEPRQSALLSAYVRSLVKPGTEEQVAQRRRVVRAVRVADSVPAEPGDPMWSSVPGTWLPLMPLWWRNQPAQGCVVRAVHDGTTLALRLTFEDPTHDAEFLGADTFGDAAALQWSLDASPPLFTMGEQGRPVNLWQWKAGWELDMAGVRDVAALHPHTPPDQYGLTDAKSEALYITARAAGNPMAVAARSSPGEVLTAEGFGTLAVVGGDAPLHARSRWNGGFWDVVFARSFASQRPGELALLSGAPVRFAAAVWDGASKDRNGQKSVTVWHTLEIER